VKAAPSSLRVISVSTAVFDGYDLSEAFAELAGLGVRHVEPAYIQGYVAFNESTFAEANAAPVAAALQAHGLDCIAVSAHVDAGAPEAVDQLARRLAFAARLGAKIVITNATTRERERQFRANLDRLIPIAADLGMVIALENPGHGQDNLIGSAQDAVGLIASIGCDQVRINYDVGNIFTYSGERLRPEDDLTKVLPACAHLHLKDIRSGPDGWTFVPIGDGAVDYGTVLAEVARLAPALPLGIELPLRLHRPGRADPVRRETRVPLGDIREAVARSLRFVAEALGNGQD